MIRNLKTYLVALGLLLITACSSDDNDVVDDSTVDLTEIGPSKKPSFNFAVASDVHFFDPSLIIKDGEAFKKAAQQDRKLLREGAQILDNLIDQVIEKKPQFFMIAGDLTKDGEKISHMNLAKKLRRLKDAGIPTFVIPGNHDINNPHAVAYDGNKTSKTEYIGPNEFAEIYGDFGYNLSTYLERGPELCYLAEPVEGVWLIGIDACIYKNNIAEDYPRTGGELDKKRMDWIKAKIKEGKSQGKQVIAMMHQGLIKHFDLQTFIASFYLVKDYENVSKELANAGLEFIFTGHLHCQNIALEKYGDNSIYEIQTGSAVTYPCPYRTIEIESDKMKVRTHDILLNGSITNNRELRDYAYIEVTDDIFGTIDAFLDANSPNIITDVIFKLFKYVKNNWLDELEPLVGEIYATFLAGDENGVDVEYTHKITERKEDAMEFLGGVFDTFNLPSIFNMIEDMVQDDAPADRNVDLPIKK